MSKERLKEIQEKYDMWADDFNLDPQDVEWLIDQAELVQGLESENNALKTVAMSNKFIGEHYRQQNKRYRETLEFYAEKENYRKTYHSFSDTGHSESVVQQDAGKKARNLLRGINNAGL